MESTAISASARHTYMGAALLLLATMFSMNLSAAAHPAPTVGPDVSVIVQGFDGQASLRAAVEAVGGTVERNLSIVRGVEATVPAGSVDVLENMPSIYQVTPNESVAFEAKDYTLDPNRVPANAGSDRLWAEGVTGDGVTVALLDTGVYAAHPDLAGRIAHCEDLSSEAGTPAECQDTFGHGTFMAGLIAGNGASSGGSYKGTAPGAKIVSVKVAGFDGSTDVSNILGGIQWVVAHRQTYGIKALNLSLGTDSAQDYRTSPLNYAVERAWNSGISVVVSAGNSGPDTKTILKPADDPFVITVGASNDEGTVAISDDRVPVFSSRGPTRSNGLAKPDIVAPGTHTISLRSPGSAIDQQYGSQAKVGDFYFRGTGTSMAAASVTGIVAQIIQANPSLSPNQVKHRLMSTARSIAERDANAAGKGLVDAYAATRSTSTAQANQGGLLGLTASTGLGTIQASRGSLAIDLQVGGTQVPLQGEYKAQVDLLDKLVPWASLPYTLTGWDPATWALTSFSGDDWAGATWRGATWRATEWDGATWRGATWRNSDWEGATWRGAEWDGATWRASNWQSAWYAAAWN